MKLKSTFLSLALGTFTLLFYSACNKTESSASADKARLQVRLTDDPGDYDAVFIDVQDIRINYSSDTATGWQSLPGVARGSYNLLTLVNDRDTLLSDAEIATGRIEQIRLLLGSNNYVMVDGQKYDLTTPSAQQSGLKIKLNQDVNEGVLYKLLLDFDVAKSIHQTGSGKYMLKPVIRAMMEAVGGSLRGYVLPNTVKTAVLAIQGTDTVASTYTLNGGYILKGLTAGTYTLRFLPDSPYIAQTRNGVVVGTNAVTTVDTIRVVR